MFFSKYFHASVPSRPPCTRSKQTPNHVREQFSPKLGPICRARGKLRLGAEEAYPKRTGHWGASRRAIWAPPRRAVKLQGALVAILVEVMQANGAVKNWPKIKGQSHLSRRAWIHCQTTDKKAPKRGPRSSFAFSAHYRKSTIGYWRALHEDVNLGR